MDDSTTPVAPNRQAAPPRRPALVGRSEPVAALVVTLAGQLEAGREAELGLHLPIEGVSRRHAVFEVDARGEVVVRDLGSTNGTLVDGVPVESTTLRGGELIQLGAAEFEFVRATAAELQQLESIARARAAIAQLSPREREVAALVADGLRSQEIATRLHISLRTVNTHLEHIYERLDVRSRLLLARLLGEAMRSR
ncbi:MAG: FHA domain-containing protein [Deltaproteobacteria bacterium]|nr:FHA domain-containing protein [Deltaproteobacteria bacterium]MBK8236970.1 FHA domain-containing protein [Deltaproteobacteria bacterium]MBK8719179.1 FHA domain-containing protein [Deltaproteobacteria bacterium]MBP7289779.1 FHA domain-containing protein [Nannocystaceae bacterium]